MNGPQPSSSLTLDHGSAAPAAPDHAAPPTAAAEVSRAEALQRSGRRAVVAGFVITILGVVGYCAACFAGGVDADMGDILFRNSVPFARATLGVLGLGTLVWLVGSITYIRGMIDADADLDG